MCRLRFVLFGLTLFGASGSALADLGETRLSLSGALNHEISHRFEARSDVRNRIGASCMGPWPSLMLTLDSADHPVGLKLSLRLPAKPETGEHALSLAGQKDSVRTGLQIIHDGRSRTAVLKRGELSLHSVGEQYAGALEAQFMLPGESAPLSVKGEFRTSLVAGSCHS